MSLQNYLDSVKDQLKPKPKKKSPAASLRGRFKYSIEQQIEFLNGEKVYLGKKDNKEIYMDKERSWYDEVSSGLDIRLGRKNFFNVVKGDNKDLVLECDSEEQAVKKLEEILEELDNGSFEEIILKEEKRINIEDEKRKAEKEEKERLKQ